MAIKTKKLKTSKKRAKEERTIVEAPIIVEEPPDPGALLWNIEPTEERWETAKVLIWRTVCLRYRLYRIESSLRSTVEFGCCYDHNGQWLSVKADIKLGNGYPKYYKTLGEALRTVEEYHGVKERTTVTSNGEALLDAMAKKGLATAYYDTTDSPPVPFVETIMNVKEADARQMFTAMGLSNVEKWSVKKLQTKLNNIAEAADGAADPTGDDLTLFRSISKSLEDGKEIVVGVVTAEKNGKAKGKKIAVPEGKKSSQKKKAKTSKGDGVPSNKEIVYKAWIASKKKADKTELSKVAKGNVKDGTISSWLGGWKKDKDLPACAKAK